MARAAILSCFGALLAVFANVVVGILHGLGLVSLTDHTYLALPTTILALFCWMVVLFYFIGAVAWVQQEVAERELSESLVAASRSIRGAAIPAIVAAVLGLIAAYVMGGGADTGAVPPAVHLGLGLAALLLHVVATYRSVVFVGMALELQERVEAAESG